MMKKILAAVAVAAFAVAASSASAATYTFTRDLTIGSTGADVVALQDVLISNGYLVMPAGVSKGYFGQLTASAVAKWQMSAGISPAAGYFGPISRAALSKVDTGTGSNNGGSTGGSNSGSNDLSGGDGDFKSFKILGNPNNEDIEEGETMEVLGFEFEAKDSDLLIERVDVLFADTAEEKRPWRIFDEVSIVDEEGDEVVTVDASDEDNWSEEEDDEYSIRLDDVDFKADEGEKVQLYVAVTAQDNLDTEDFDGEWEVSLLDTDAIRAINAEGIDVYEGRTTTKEFTVEEAEAGDIEITVDDDDNEDQEVEISEDDDTEDVVLYTAMLESKDGMNNIEEITVDIDVTSGTSTASDIIKTLYLFIDGDEVGSESVNASTAPQSVTFDDIDFDLDEDEEVELTVVATVNENDGDYDMNSAVTVLGLEIDYVDQNDDDQTVTETTDGGEISFSLDAIQVAFDSEDSEAPVANNEAQGRFYVTFKVTAPSEEDIYIPKGATLSTTSVQQFGAAFSVLDANGNYVTGSTTSNTLTRVSGGSETGGRYKVTKGNTATFRLDVVVDNTNASSARALGVGLVGINYKAGTNANADTLFTAGLDEDFRSSTEYLLTSNTEN